jgi:ubiquinone/menaquinone biosynthesis C-methylase UbiE
MRYVWLLCLAACVSHPVARPGEPRPIVATGNAPAFRPVELDEASVIQKSHDLFDAWDRHDIRAFQAMVGPAFVMFERARFYDAAFIIKGMQAKLDRHAPVRTREWKEQKVYRGGGALVFIGEAVEHVAQDGESPAADWQGWNTVVWVHDGESWKAEHAQWQKSGLAAERDQWNEVFEKSIGFKKTANQHLIDAVKGRKPGTALDVATGQGRNAVYLATQGWKVTAIDIADEGLRMTQEAAAKQKVKVETLNVDADTYDYGKDRWDLVTLIYAGDDPKLIAKIKPSIKKGGLFVVEFFYKDATAGTGIGGFEDGELAAAFAGWKIVTDVVVEDLADWSLRKVKLVRFTAERP